MSCLVSSSHSNQAHNGIDDVSETYVQMMSTMSGGNPQILLRDATTYVWTENAKRLSEQEKEEESQ